MFRKSRGKFLLIIILAIIWWWVRRPKDESVEEVEPSMITLPETTGKPPTKRVPAKTPSTSKSEVSITPKYKVEPTDDLKRIYGIGPKTYEALLSAGIRSFAQLSKMNEAQIREALEGSGARTVGIDTWPKQARLAAAGKWEELEEFQNNLKTN